MQQCSMHHKSRRASVICEGKLRLTIKCCLVNSQVGTAYVCAHRSVGGCMYVRVRGRQKSCSNQRWGLSANGSGVNTQFKRNTRTYNASECVDCASHSTAVRVWVIVWLTPAGAECKLRGTWEFSFAVSLISSPCFKLVFLHRYADDALDFGADFLDRTMYGWVCCSCNFKKQ